MLDSAQEIQTGMIVKLKGSVIPMSVNGTEGNSAACYWFDGLVLHKGDFNNSDIVVHAHEIGLTPVLAGYKVVLKSGGPVMHVERIEFSKSRPYAICSWQANEDHYLKKFNSLVLLKVNE